MAPQGSFEYPESLQEYLISEGDFYKQNPQFNKLVVGAVIFDTAGKMLLVQRAKDEKAFPNLWEIPGGAVDDTDETILHAVARECMEETGLEVARFVRMVGAFSWEDYHARRKRHEVWQKLIFEVEVQGDVTKVVLDAHEHQSYLFASQAEVMCDQTESVPLSWISPANKEMNMQAFSQRGLES